MILKKGDTVTVTYVGTLQDGSIFSTTEGEKPITFTIGKEELLPSFESALIGKKKGETILAEIAPEDGYGERDEELVLSFEKDMFAEVEHLEIGMPITMDLEDDEELEVFVKSIEDTTITIDANHPLAGERLFFSITIL